MPGFRQTGACVETSRTLNLGTGRVPRARSFPVSEIPGETLCPAPAACPVCGGRTRPNGAASCRLAHLPFRAPGRMATLALVRLVEDLLAYGLTPTDVALATGLCRQVVREIDRKRLARLYTRVFLQIGVHSMGTIFQQHRRLVSSRNRTVGSAAFFLVIWS